MHSAGITGRCITHMLLRRHQITASIYFNYWCNELPAASHFDPNFWFYMPQRKAGPYVESQTLSMNTHWKWLFGLKRSVFVKLAVLFQLVLFCFSFYCITVIPCVTVCLLSLLKCETSNDVTLLLFSVKCCTFVYCVVDFCMLTVMQTSDSFAEGYQFLMIHIDSYYHDCKRHTWRNHIQKLQAL